jgi:hypothetical protein
LQPEGFPPWLKYAQVFFYFRANVEVDLADAQVIVLPDASQEHHDDGI